MHSPCAHGEQGGGVFGRRPVAGRGDGRAESRGLRVGVGGEFFEVAGGGHAGVHADVGDLGAEVGGLRFAGERGKGADGRRGVPGEELAHGADRLQLVEAQVREREPRGAGVRANVVLEHVVVFDLLDVPPPRVVGREVLGRRLVEVRQLALAHEVVAACAEELPEEAHGLELRVLPREFAHGEHDLAHLDLPQRGARPLQHLSLRHNVRNIRVRRLGRPRPNDGGLNIRVRERNLEQVPARRLRGHVLLDGLRLDRPNKGVLEHAARNLVEIGRSVLWRRHCDLRQHLGQMVIHGHVACCEVRHDVFGHCPISRRRRHRAVETACQLMRLTKVSQPCFTPLADENMS